MSKITIGKTDYEVIDTELNQQELLFYEDNPRVFSILHADGVTPSQQEIEEKMISMDHVKALRLSIDQNGGLIDPLVVVNRAGSYVVLEGNSRLAAYRMLYKKDPIKWSMVKVQILPEEISDDDIFKLLGQYHLIGRKDWSIFEQAAYLFRQKEFSGLDNSILAKNVGLPESKVNSLIEVYQFMKDHDDLVPDRWSYYEEYLKNRALKHYRRTSTQIDDTFVRKVKAGDIKKAVDVREKLGEIAKGEDGTSKRIMQEFIEGRTDVYDGYERLVATGKTGDSFQKLKRFRDHITDVDFQRKLKQEIAASNNRGDMVMQLKKIKQAVDKLLRELDN